MSAEHLPTFFYLMIRQGLHIKQKSPLRQMTRLGLSSMGQKTFAKLRISRPIKLIIFFMEQQ